MYTEEEQREIDEWDDFVVGIVLMFAAVAVICSLLPKTLDFIFIEEKVVTTTTVLAPGDLAISGARYVGVSGDVVEFQEGDKTMKFSFEKGKEVSLRVNRSVTLKAVSGDNLTISETRYTEVNRFTNKPTGGDLK